MKLTRRALGASAMATAMLSATSLRAAPGKLTAYMGPPEPTCAELMGKFDKAWGGKSTFLRLSAGEAVNRIRAEKDRPQASIITGIGLPSMMTLKAEGLLKKFELKDASKIPANYVDPEGYWVGTDVDFLSFASNQTFLKERGLKAPQSWGDLLAPELKGQVCIGSPATSGTGYMFMATVIQLMGETEGWDYIRRFSENVAQFTRSGIGPTQLVGRGELGVGILFAHDTLGAIDTGYPVEISVPAEGTGYDLFCCAVINNGPEPEGAEAFVNWMTTPDAQETLAESGYYDVPTNTEAKLHPLVEPWAKIKLIDFDFAWAGHSDTRKALVEKFQTDILAGRG